MLQRVINRL